MKKILMLLVVAAASMGLVVAITPSAEAAGEGCVTYNEALRTFTDGHQLRAEIQNGLGATPMAIDKHGDNLLRASYRPCLRPDDRAAPFVEVIYTRNRVGQWRSFFWVYYLYSPSPWARGALTDSWSDMGR